MTPPEEPMTGQTVPDVVEPPAVSVCPPDLFPPEISQPAACATETLRQRADFLRAASARRQGMPGFLLQARERREGAMIRIGFTCSKKLGNAVTRNRAKRRLRALARAVLPVQGRSGWDYVLVGRPGATVERNFGAMILDLEQALRQIHAPRPPR